MRILRMRARQHTILLVVVLLGLAVVAVRAQEEEPVDQPAPKAKPYVAPPAWKSVEIGDYYLKRKRYNAALSRYQEAVQMDPFYAAAYLGLGKCYDKIGLKQKALEAYKKYLDALPSEKQALEAKDVQKAVARLEKQLAPRGRSSHAASPQR
jgi:tetratricopeptide (TPR) repeat protein